MHRRTREKKRGSLERFVLQQLVVPDVGLHLLRAESQYLRFDTKSPHGSFLIHAHNACMHACMMQCVDLHILLQFRTARGTRTTHAFIGCC